MAKPATTGIEYTAQGRTQHMLRPMFILAAALTLPGDVAAQEVIDWSDFELCLECQLDARPFLALGDQTGDGTIDGEYMRVVGAEGRGYMVYQMAAATSLTVFDESGGYLRRIGTEGDGPGEFRLIADLAFGDANRIVVLDYHRSTWITLTESGELVGETPMRDLNVGMFRLVEGERSAVVGVYDRRPDLVGYPLHAVDLASGSATNHFGVDDGSWDMSAPFAGAMVLGEDERLSHSAWWGKVGEPHFEEWSLKGEHLRTVAGALEFFPVAPQTRDPAVPPPVAVADFAVDSADRLWLLTMVPDARWRNVRRQGAEGGVPRELYDVYRDIRLDVFDLSRRTHLGFRKWDSITAKLTRKGHAVFVTVLEYETPQWPRIVLYGIDFNSPSERR